MRTEATESIVFGGVDPGWTPSLVQERNHANDVGVERPDAIFSYC
jgi:hypothetical protein